jgi:hypothetical protein
MHALIHLQLQVGSLSFLQQKVKQDTTGERNTGRLKTAQKHCDGVYHFPANFFLQFFANFLLAREIMTRLQFLPFFFSL